MGSTFFEKAVPAQAGIPAGRLLDYLKALENRRLCMHSVMLVKDGMQVLDAYYKPFGPESRHRIYSCSKSMVSLAIGILAGEGKIALDDPVSRYFPDLLPENPHPFMLKDTIRDLLRMATAFDDDTTSIAIHDWVASHFRTEPTHLPGTIFHYDTSGTVMLTAIVERVTGQPFLEYLRPRLLDPLCISKDIRCIQTPDGYSWGGSGVICTALDLAKIAYVCMHKGQYNGKQLIPRDYLEKALTRQIDTVVNHLGFSPYGYGYQVWVMPHGFAFKGMGGQIALCLPEKDTMLVTTGDTQEMADDMELVPQIFYEKVYPYLDTALPDSEKEDQAELDRHCAEAKLQVVQGSPVGSGAERYSGREFEMLPNSMKITRMRLDFSGKDGTLSYSNASGDHVLEFGMGWNKPGVFPETTYSGYRIGVPKGEGYRCTTSAAWADENTLILCCYIIDDYLGMMRVQFTFGDDSLTVLMTKVAEYFLEEYEGFATGFCRAEEH